jgi:hypothetical protein
VINVFQKSPSEGISQLWDDWIGEDSIGSYQSNLGLSNHPIVERCLSLGLFWHALITLFVPFENNSVIA